MSDFVLSQVLIGFVFFLDIASFQFKQQRHVLMLLAAAAFLIGVHFWLLQLHTAAVLGILASARFLTAIFTNSRKLLLLFLLVVLLSCLLTWAGLLTLLATIGSLCSTVGAFSATDRNFRRLMMLSSLLWITHNLLAHTPAAVILETVFLASNFVGYYRFYIRGVGGRVEAELQRAGDRPIPGRRG